MTLEDRLHLLVGPWFNVSITSATVKYLKSEFTTLACMMSQDI